MPRLSPWQRGLLARLAAEEGDGRDPGLDAHGSVVSGCIDVLVETESGFWILDHKSDASDGFEEGFRRYLPQLLCYAAIVARARPDKPVQGVAVNWIMHGCVTMMGVGTSFNKHGRFDIS